MSANGPAPIRIARKRHVLLVLATLLLIAAVWMPPIKLPRRTFSYVVTFDITQSMDVEDVEVNGVPTSRLALARAAMRDVLRHLPCGSTIGWSVFTGRHALLSLRPVEVCGNYDALLSSLGQINGKMRWANGSVIAQGGIYAAVRTAAEIGGHTAVVFMTDGQEAPPVSPSETTVRDVTPGQVGGWLIGLGGDQPVPIPRTNAAGVRTGYWQADDVIQLPPTPGVRRNVESHEELSAVHETYLKALADHLGFGYKRLMTSTALSAALTDPRLAHRDRVPTDLRWCPALLGWVLLIVCFLPDGYPRVFRPSICRGPLRPMARSSASKAAPASRVAADAAHPVPYSHRRSRAP